ncbi:phytanoyl-CoA dioxygenase family protein [Caenispirillum salinarum]|uniref:phytanoyl-CoA dioxygenase family protein n=1 Tax=Caenispirillum salinarum TaxID=859058 RepID=UPI00384D439B
MIRPELVRLPAAAAEPGRIAEALDRDGAVIIENRCDAALLGAVRQDLAPWFDRTPPGDGLFFGRRTVRFGGVIVKSTASQDLCLDDAVLRAAEHVLLPRCSAIQLNLSQAISIGPGEPEQVLHGDDEMWPVPRGSGENMINAMWALSEFTVENGATRIVPGSHREPIRRVADPSEIAYAEMSPGSVVLWRGSALHGGGANWTDGHRRGVVMSYALGWLRQAENQYLVAPPEVARSMPSRLRDLLGYRVHVPSLGHFEGQDPSIVFENPAGEPQPFRDHLPSEARSELEAYYGVAAE